MLLLFDPVGAAVHLIYCLRTAWYRGGVPLSAARPLTRVVVGAWTPPFRPRQPAASAASEAVPTCKGCHTPHHALILNAGGMFPECVHICSVALSASTLLVHIVRWSALWVAGFCWHRSPEQAASRALTSWSDWAGRCAQDATLDFSTEEGQQWALLRDQGMLIGKRLGAGTFGTVRMCAPSPASSVCKHPSSRCSRGLSAPLQSLLLCSSALALQPARRCVSTSIECDTFPAHFTSVLPFASTVQLRIQGARHPARSLPILLPS